MIKRLFVFIFSASFFTALAQKTSQSVFVEAGGIGLPYSFSYDTRFNKGSNDGIGGRIGFGGFVVEDEKMLTVPLQLNWLLGKGTNFFELGIGATYLHYDGYSYYEDYTCNNTGCFPSGKLYAGDFILPISSVNSFMGTLNFGYRKQPVSSGFTWKAAITPVFNDNGFWPLFAGVAVGYKF